MTQRVPLTGLSFLLLSGFGLAQLPQRSATPDLGAVLSGWQARHGTDWRMALDGETGFVQMLYGGHTAAVPVPADDAGFFELARTSLNESIGLHGIDDATLVNERTLFLPLGQIGSNDKLTVRFTEAVDGVPVEGGFVNVLYDMRGRVLSIQSTGLPHVAGFDVHPTVGSEAALQSAVASFRARTGLLETSVTGPDLVVDQYNDDGIRIPRLAWKVDVHANHPDVQPEGFVWFVDARTGDVYRNEKTVHDFDVSGSVTSNATPGLSSDNPANPPTQQTMSYMSVASGSTTVPTDTNGNFNLPGLTAPISVTVRYAGQWCNVLNDAGAAYQLTTTANNPTGNAIQMNTTPDEATTSQANIFRAVHLGRDFIKAINPSDTTPDFTVIAHAMVNSTCNANYDGSAINFYHSGNGCSNFGFSTIINHELGHWMNSRYNTGNGSDGMGEGNADVWEMYVYDNPVGGLGAYNGTGFIRTGLNTRQFCGDAHPGCYGEVHNDGEVWMGAAWKVRANLETALGVAPGGLAASTIFLGWMNAYNQTQIRSIIETQWLTLDDNNGTLADSTPHYGQIDPGFRAQGFPGLTEVVIDTVTGLTDTISTTGPYVVSAHILSPLNPPIVTAQVKYRVNGGSFQTVNMSALAGDVYSGAIPGQAALSHVEYYVTASNMATSTSVYPKTSPNVVLGFDIGVKHTLVASSFDGATDEGWTHGAYNGTDEWQRGIPQGKSGTGWVDPSSAISLSNVWGQDLGLGSAGGSYSANSFTWLRTPTFDCTNAVHTHLRFDRWLSVQGSASDQARILVNGSLIYLNPTASVNDATWYGLDYDISSFADGNPAVTIEWSIQANATTNRGGWNIDDVSVVWVESPPTCPAPVNYCVGAPNSVGPGAVMDGLGTQFISQNNFVIDVTGCPPSTNGLFFFGPNPTQVAFGNGFRCVGGTIRRFGAQPTDFLGGAQRAIDVNDTVQPIHAGETWRFQFWYRNPAGGGAGFNLSDGLEVTFCP